MFYILPKLFHRKMFFVLDGRLGIMELSMAKQYYVGCKLRPQYSIN